MPTRAAEKLEFATRLNLADEGRGKLEFATRLNLEKLARHSDTEAAVAAAHAAKIVTVLPVLSGPEPNALPSFPPKRTTAAASL